MNSTIDDLMVPDVVVISPDTTVAEARTHMLRGGIHSLPVVNERGAPVGMVTSTDLMADCPSDAPVEQVMTRGVFTVPRYADAHVAARVMHNHKLHHVVVTHEQRVVGILSSFDLLRLVEEHRFVMKNPPTPPRRSPRRA